VKNKWNVLRLSGIGFVAGFVLFLVRALVQEAGTDLDPGSLVRLVFLGGMGGAVLLAAAATVRNFFLK
jgi:uncharacterized membrane protein YdcZ (DUF606 family)